MWRCWAATSGTWFTSRKYTFVKMNGTVRKLNLSASHDKISEQRNLIILIVWGQAQGESRYHWRLSYVCLAQGTQSWPLIITNQEHYLIISNWADKVRKEQYPVVGADLKTSAHQRFLLLRLFVLTRSTSLFWNKEAAHFTWLVPLLGFNQIWCSAEHCDFLTSTIGLHG